MTRMAAIALGVLAGLATTVGVVVALAPEPLPPLAQAINAEEHGDLPRAEAIYRSVLEEQPGSSASTEASRRLAGIRRGRGEFAEAEALMREVVDRPGATPGDLLLWGELLLANRDPRGAASAWQRLAEQADASLEARLEAAGRLGAIGRMVEAEAAYLSLMGTEVKVAAQASLGALDASVGRYPSAATRIDEARVAQPSSAWASAARGALALSLGDLAGAGEALDEALRRDPYSRIALLARAELDLQLQDPGRSLSALRQALSVGEDPQLRLALARAELAGARRAQPQTIKAGEEQCRALGASAPGHPLAFECDARVAVAKGEAGRAQGILKSVLEMAPGRAEAAALLVEILRGVGDERGALLESERWLQSWTGPLAMRVERGRILTGMQRFDEAAAELEALVVERPAYWKGHLAIAELEAARGGLARAEAESRVAVELAPQLAEPRLALGRFLRQRGQEKAARAEYEAILAQRPTEIRAHLGLAASCASLGEDEAAIEHLKRAAQQGATVDDLSGEPGFERLAEDPDFSRLLPGGG